VDPGLTPPAGGPKLQSEMIAVILDESIRIPGKAASLETFRRWARSPDFPARGRYSYLRDEVWVDRSAEELYTHNQVKGQVASPCCSRRCG